MNRNFFNTNSIQNLQPFTPKRIQSSTTQRFHTIQKLKRVTSCSNNISKINPQKFINRQAFNSKLYSTKPFNIAVEFNKQQNLQLQKLYSFQNSQNYHQLINKIQKQNSHTFLSVIKNITRCFKTLHQQTQSHNVQNSNSVANQLVLMKQAVQKILNIFYKEIDHHQKAHLQILFDKKSKQTMQNMSRPLTQTKTLLNARNSSLSAKQFGQSTQMNFFSKQESTFIKQYTSSSLRSSQQLVQKGITSAKYKKITDKLNLIQFENKKHILYIQTLQKQKEQKQQKIKELQRKVNEMSVKIQKVNEIQQFYNYKIKKLKEQLQVAHIVKQQNLAQKMKYILHN